MDNTEKIKVLIADSEKDIRFLVNVYLRDYDIDLIEAKDGKECLELIKKESPNLLILNYMLDKLSGYQVAEDVYREKLLKNSFIIIMTLEGFDLAKDKLGVDEYLPKPFSRKQFIEIVKKVAGEKFLKKRINDVYIIKSEIEQRESIKEEKSEKRKKILIADDEPNILKLLELILKKDYDVKTAASGEELIEKVEEGNYDLIISDVVMPKLSGWKSVKEIRKKGYNMPVIFNSGLVKDKELYETLKPSGISLFILKPFNKEQIIIAVKKLLL